MGWIKRIQTWILNKIILIKMPRTGWIEVVDSNGPFKHFWSLQNAIQMSESGQSGHRFILYKNTNKLTWTLIDFATDKVSTVLTLSDLSEKIPKAFNI